MSIDALLKLQQRRFIEKALKEFHAKGKAITVCPTPSFELEEERRIARLHPRNQKLALENVAKKKLVRLNKYGATEPESKELYEHRNEDGTDQRDRSGDITLTKGRA